MVVDGGGLDAVVISDLPLYLVAMFDSRGAKGGKGRGGGTLFFFFFFSLGGIGNFLWVSKRFHRANEEEKKGRVRRRKTNWRTMVLISGGPRFSLRLEGGRGFQK